MKKLADAKEYLDTWLERSREVMDAAPHVRRLQELVDWELRTYDNRPEEAQSVESTELNRHAIVFYDRLTSTLPMLPSVDSKSVAQVSSLSATTSNAFVTYVTTVSQLQTPAAIRFAAKAIAEFGKLKEREQRPADVRRLLELRMPSLISKFDVAHTSCNRCKALLGDRTGAALEMRTLLDGVQGELMQRARKHERENMTLPLACERLFSPSSMYREIQEEVEGRSALYSLLSEVAKQRDAQQAFQLDALWVRTLNHIFIVIGGFE
jgi:hypothetical protein